MYPALVEFHVESVVDITDSGISRSGKKQGKLSTGRPSNRHAKQGSSYKVIVKTGDDLHQDQLAMMMFKLMDRLLKRGSLDLCLTPYSIIVTSPSSGVVEFLDGSCPVSHFAVLSGCGPSEGL